MTASSMHFGTFLFTVPAIFAAWACSGGEDGEPNQQDLTSAAGAPGAGPSASSAGGDNSTAGFSGATSSAGEESPSSSGSGGRFNPSPGAGGANSVQPQDSAGGSPASPPPGSAGAPPVLPPSGAGGSGAVVPPSEPPPPAGPNDGDPSRPVVAIDGIKCGPNPSLFGLTETNVTIGGRDVHVAYPCNKHAGAPVTFILNLHGTMPDETLKLYQVAYCSINTLVDSHNFITVAPKSKSAVGQWGNGAPEDEPHLMEVIDWVYSTFSEFDIRQMWVGGHSWGAMYTSTFACKAELADKVKGAIIMSGLPVPPACASRISVLNTVGEIADAAPVNQGNIPAQHGCDGPMEQMLGNNRQTLWPNCDPGFVHSNYLMLGKGHIDYMDPEVVKSLGDLINQARP